MTTDVVTNEPLQVLPPELIPSVEHLVTEDGAPVDNVFSEKQQRLLTEALHSSWSGAGHARPFVAMANVGLFYAIRQPPLVPDVLLSLDVELPVDVRVKAHRCYFTWEYGKAPDVAIEIVSNREGGEDTGKLAAYARLGVRYYAIFDPERLLCGERLRGYRLVGLAFEEMTEPLWLPDVGLGLRLWQGRYEDLEDCWLRWFDAGGTPIPTGRERAELERQRAELECQRAELERQRADRLAEQLRRLGVEPEE